MIKGYYLFIFHLALGKIDNRVAENENKKR